MKWEPTVLWLVTICSGFIKNEASNSHLDIWCLEDSQRGQDDLMKRVGNDLQTCKFEETDDYPFSYGHVETPAAPESISTSVQVFNTSDATSMKQIAVFISWRYKKEYFKAVEQYHIEMNYFTIYGLHRQFLFMWDGNLTEAIDNSTAQFLRFHFIYTGPGLDGKYDNKPNDEFHLRLQGLPMYAEDTEPQDVMADVTIPGCDETVIRMSQKCDKARECKPEQTFWNNMCITPTRRRPPHRKSPKAVTRATNPRRPMAANSVVVVVATVASVAFVVLLGFIWCMCMRTFRDDAKGVQSHDGKAHILFICTKDNGFIDAINQLIEMIMKIPNIEVVCNLRQRTEIGMHGIQEWTKREVGNCNLVCFVVANQFEISEVEGEVNEKCRLDDVEKHQLAIVISAIETMVVNKALENSLKKFIVLDLGGCVKKERLPYFTRYRLPADFKKFFKCIPGKIADSQKNKLEKEKKVFLNLLSNAQLGYSHTISGYDEESEFSVKNVTQSQHIKGNNLDDVGEENECLDENESRLGNDFSLNIPPSTPPSYEVPRSDDFNHSNEVEHLRYIQTGARPKQTNC